VWWPLVGGKKIFGSKLFRRVDGERMGKERWGRGIINKEVGNDGKAQGEANKKDCRGAARIVRQKQAKNRN